MECSYCMRYGAFCSCTHVVQSTSVLIWFCSSMFLFARLVLLLSPTDLQTWQIVVRIRVQIWPELPAPSLWPSSMPPLLSPKVKRVARHLSDRQRQAGEGQDWAAIVFVETKVRLTPGAGALESAGGPLCACGMPKKRSVYASCTVGAKWIHQHYL
jgi:hypothetical protein